MSLEIDLKNAATASLSKGHKAEANLYLSALSFDPTLLSELLDTLEIRVGFDDSSLYAFLHKASAHTGLSLNDVVKKVNDAFKNLKTKLPIGNDIKELLTTDVLDVEGLKISLDNLINDLKVPEKKVEPQVLNDVYQHTIKNTKPSELDEMTRQLVENATSEFKKVFEGTELNEPHFWTILKAEASKMILTLDPVLRSRFVPLLQRYGQDALTKLNLGKKSSVASLIFTAEEIQVVWDKAIIESVYQAIFYGNFPQDLVLLSIGQKLDPKEVKEALEDLSTNKVWMKLFVDNATEVEATSWIENFNTAFIASLKKFNSEVNEKYLSPIVSSLLQRYVSESEALES
jgi:hypothetical protein